MEAPVITYVGEISEPRLRGILTSYSGIFVTLGLIVEFLLGTLTDWNTAAFYSSFVPIVTFIAISQVPETPMWLLSKNRVKEAETALCWLRGWVHPSEVQKELNELIRYSNASKLVLKEKKPKIDDDKKKKTLDDKKLEAIYCNPVVTIEDEKPPGYYSSNETNDEKSAVKTNGKTADAKFENIPLENVDKSAPKSTDNLAVQGTTTQRKPTFVELLRDVTRPQMLKPLALVIAFFVFHNGSGFPAVRPYMVNVFEELRFPVDAHWATVIVSIVGFLGVITCMVLVKIVGKRALTLGSLAGCAASMMALSIWALINLKQPDSEKCWTPFLLFITLSYSFSFGIAPIPWMILSEVFPFRGRGLASGVAAAVSYSMGFATSKTFLDLKNWLGLSGVFCMYGSITIFGIFYVYFKLPETEGRSLEDIEKHYNMSKKEKKAQKLAVANGV